MIRVSDEDRKHPENDITLPKWEREIDVEGVSILFDETKGEGEEEERSEISRFNGLGYKM